MIDPMTFGLGLALFGATIFLIFWCFIDKRPGE